MLAWRLLWRDIRSGELRVLSTAIVLAVAIVTSIGLFVERLQGSILNQSKDFLAADMVLQGSRPADEAWIRHAEENGLLIASTLQFQSMVAVGERIQLASVKAVSELYPLRGRLLVSDSLQGERRQLDKGPEPGSVWIDSRLMPLLDITVGDTLQLGDTRLKVTALVHAEPDRGSGFYSIGPRVLMNKVDIAASAVVQPGSQVTYRLLLKGAKSTRQQFKQWLVPQLSENYRWLDVKNNQPMIGVAMNRAETFLMLGGALGVLLASVAAALAAYRYSERHTDYAALMKSLGASSTQIQQIYLLLLLSITVCTTVVGWLIGWFAQWVYIGIAGSLLGMDLPQASLKPLLTGAVTALVCVVGFALPPLWSLRTVPPLRVLRGDIEGRKLSLSMTVLMGAMAIVLLLLWYSADPLLVGSIMLGIGVSAVILVFFAFALLRGSHLVGMGAASIMGLALSNLRRRSWQNAVHIFIFSLAIMLLLILSLVRTTLINEWRMQLPEDTPNHFLFNIAADEVGPLADWLHQSGTQHKGLYPMVRGRLVGIGEQSVLQRVSRESLHKAGADREMNLTWAAKLPQDNRIVEGQWWSQGSSEVLGAEAQVSIEKSLAKNLGISVGEKLIFRLGDEMLEARVRSIRYLQWQTMQPNFYVIFNPGVLDSYSATHITSFFLPVEKKHLLHQLIKRFPTISMIEIDAVIEQVRRIISQVSLAIESLLAVILLAGGLVLVASVQSSMSERYQECAILRALGASRRRVLGSVVTEFAVLGLIAGSLAVIGAELSVYFLQTRLFRMPYNIHPELWWWGPLLGVVLITGIGYVSTRKIVSTPPIQVLRQIE